MTTKQKEVYDALLTRAFSGKVLTEDENELLNKLGKISVEQRKLNTIIETYTK